MNKFIKCLIATGLSVATILSNFNTISTAWDDDEFNWINLEDLNKNGIISLSEKQCKKRLGWDKCTEDVVKLDSVEKYVDMLIENYNNLKKDKNSYENNIRISSINANLEHLKNFITHSKKDNCIYFVNILDPFENYGWYRSTYNKEINSNHKKENLESLIESKINPTLKDINLHLKESFEEKPSNHSGSKIFDITLWGLKLTLLSIVVYQFLPKNLDVKKLVNTCKEYYNGLKKNNHPKIS